MFSEISIRVSPEAEEILKLEAPRPLAVGSSRAELHEGGISPDSKSLLQSRKKYQADTALSEKLKRI